MKQLIDYSNDSNDYFVELTYIFEENSECKFNCEIFAAPLYPPPSPLQTQNMKKLTLRCTN